MAWVLPLMAPTSGAPLLGTPEPTVGETPPRDPSPDNAIIPIEYQNDGNSGHDADDECVPGKPPSLILEPGVHEHGVLVPVDDEHDFWGIPLLQGQAVTLFMDPTEGHPDGLSYPDFEAHLLTPDCEFLAAEPQPGNRQETVTAVAPVTGIHVAHIFVVQPVALTSAEAGPLPGLRAAPPDAVPAYCHPICNNIGYGVIQFS